MKLLILKIIFPILVFTLPFGVYLYTLSPSVAPGDSTEMVTAAVVLGVPHQPSYPLNTFLGQLASRLPLPFGVVWRVNAVSAFFQALTVLLFYFLVLELFKFCMGIGVGKGLIYANPATGSGQVRLRGGERLVAFSSSMFLAFSLIFWQYATKFEVFPLNNLFAVSLLLLAVKIAFRSEPAQNLGKKAQTLRRSKCNSVRKKLGLKLAEIFLAFLAGLALTHHQTIVLIFPALIYLLSGEIRRVFADFKAVLLSLLFLVLGLLPFFGLLLWIASRKPLLNWGEVENIGGALAALIRKDFGVITSYLVGFEPQLRQAPIEQIWYYLKYLLFDFSIVGVLFIVLGICFLWKRQRRLFWFVSLGVILSGFVFLSYANFPLGDSFNQATVRRFHQLPNIFMALFLALGMASLAEWLEKLKPRKRKYRIGLGLGKAYLFLIFVFPLFMNFGKASNRGNRLVETYARHSFAATPSDALIMLSGDIPNMTVDYFRYVELGGGDRRITFSPGQFHLSWFFPQFFRKYPDVYIPLPEEGRRFTTTTQVVDANYGKRPIYVGPDLLVHDPELDEKYVLYPKHLLFLVKKKGEDLKLEEWKEENDRLWNELDLDLMQRMKRKSPMFEETIVFHYGRHFYNVGFVYEEVGLYEDAIREYKRVLEIDPFFKEALASLGRVYGEGLEPADYITAIDYLQKYQSVLAKGEEEFGMAAQAKIYEYLEKAQKEAESFGEAQDKEAAELEQIEEDLRMEASPSAEEEGNGE